MGFLNDLMDDLEDNGILEKVEEGINNFAEKAYDFADKLEDFGNSIGRNKTNNYGDLPEDEEAKEESE